MTQEFASIYDLSATPVFDINSLQSLLQLVSFGNLENNQPHFNDGGPDESARIRNRRKNRTKNSY